ncbi:MAG: MerR family transcriptional regulator [Microbacteriaceae bacterium]|nr:MerR family transcriptional regulator [Microbacteriaceae bacterium]
MRIGELSEITGASPRSLRYYESLGLISSERQANGYRDYDADAAAAVATIRSLLDLGFPTALIEHILPCTGDVPVMGDCGTLMREVARIRDEIDEKVERLASTRDALSRFLASASTGAVAGGRASAPDAPAV